MAMCGFVLLGIVFAWSSKTSTGPGLKAGVLPVRWPRLLENVYQWPRPAKHLLRSMYRVLRSRHSWQDVLLLDQSKLQDLHWRVAALKSWNDRAVLPYQTPFQMTTDASALAWGATQQGQNVQGLWSFRISFKSSNYREVLAILLGLVSFLPCLQGRAVQVLTDIVSAAAYINFQGGPSQELSDIYSDLHLDVRLGERYINFCEACRREAEYSSRLSFSSQHTVRLEALFSTLPVSRQGLGAPTQWTASHLWAALIYQSTTAGSKIPAQVLWTP